MSWLKLKSLFYYLSTSILSQFVALGCELIILKIIKPELIGIWQFFLLIHSYAIITRLGIINAFNREYPFNLEKDQYKAANINSTTLTFTTFNALFLFLIFSILSFVFLKNGANWLIASLTMAVFIFFETITTYLQGYLRCIKKFNYISTVQILSLPVVIITLLLPYKFNFIGLCLRVVIIQLFRSVLIFLYNPIKFRFEFDLKVFRSLFSVGWKFYLWSYLKNFSKTIYRLIILLWGGTNLLGLFAPVNWMTIAFTSLSGSISEYIYPILSSSLSKNPEKINKRAFLVSFYTFLVFTPFTIIGFFMITPLTNLFLPEYAQSIPAMKIALIASLFDIIPLSLIAFAVKLQFRKMYTFVIVSIGIRFLSGITFYSLFENKLLGIAYAVLCSSIILSIYAIRLLMNNNGNVTLRAENG